MSGWNWNTALPGTVKKKFMPFARHLVSIYQDQLKSIFIFGSATGKNYIEKKSDINSAVVLDHVDVQILEKALKPIAAARRHRIVAPLFMTESHIRSSLDVFPIEFMDMKDNYAVVYGQDFLKDAIIETEHVRLLCEQQIKGKLIRIRQAFLEVGLTAKGIERLLKEALDSLIPVFRSLLRLKGITPSLDKGEVIAQMEPAFSMEAAVFIAIWRDKKNDDRIGGAHVREAFAQVIEQLERLARVVDQL